MEKAPTPPQNTFTCKMNFPVPYLKKGDMEQLLDPIRAKDHWFLGWFEKFFGFKHCCFTPELLKRLEEVNNQECFMSLVPIGTPKLDTLVHSLEDACRCYCLDLCSASIALSGVAAETLTQMLWEMTGTTVKSEPLDALKQKEIFGRPFSDPYLSQYRRLRILKGLKIVTDKQFEDLDFIRDKRNDVVHFEKKISPEEERESAIHCFQKAMSLFKAITSIEIEDGKVKTIHPYFLTK